MTTASRAARRAAPVSSTPRRDIPHGALLAALSLLIVLVFCVTVAERRPWFGVLSLEHHQWLTGSTLKFTKNWYREGAGHLRFLMLENPRSVEFPTWTARGIYPSYPPGCLLGVYGVSKLLGREPDAALVMTYNLANHLLIALGLMLAAYLWLIRYVHRWHAIVFAAIPPLVALLMPAPMYWFQNVFFSDQAVILPFVLLLAAEALREHPLTARQRGWLDVVQGLILAYGFFTDWLFVFVGVTLYAKRLALGEVARRWPGIARDTAIFWAGPLVALGLFAWQITAFGQWPVLLEKYLVRGGVNATGQGQMTRGFYEQFWQGHIGHGFGALAIPVLWGTLSLLCFALLRFWMARRVTDPHRPLEGRLLAWMCLAMLPVFTEIYVLKNHSWMHDFSALKFVVPLALVPGIGIPLWLMARRGMVPPAVVTGEARPAYSRAVLGVGVTVLVLIGGYALAVHPRYRTFFPPPCTDLVTLQRDFARYGYQDIVVSHNFEIPMNPPQPLAYTMKRVYKIGSDADITALTAPIREPYTVHVYDLPGR